jgi:integration host factor subunit alpha
LYNLKKTVGGVMTKADLADRMYEKIGLSKKEALGIVEMLFDSIKGILSEGESIKITGFGTFLVRKKSARKGRNPKTGSELQIAPRKVVTFKPSLHFKALVEKAE